jgi:predicted RNase H-like HicB family nuclease
VRHYHINVFFSETRKAWVADIPDLKDCTGQGDSPIEALEEVLRSKDAWISSAEAAGRPVPAPRYRPIHYSE